MYDEKYYDCIEDVTATLTYEDYENYADCDVEFYGTEDKYC